MAVAVKGQSAAADASKKAVDGLLCAASDLLDGPRKRGTRLLDILFWSRGQEITGWGYVHEAQVRMVPLLDGETVKARLETVEQKLRLDATPRATALADAIHAALTASPAASAERLQALLAPALALSYDSEDDGFADLVSWQNKASWLVGCGLCAIVALTAVFPQHAILLLVGAAGGLISRLSRSLDRKSVPTDYGASWTTLFLSPVAGAVGAWAGIMVSVLAVKAGVLGAIFQADWSHPTGVGTLGIALLFGFSERLLDSVFDKLEGKALGTDASDAAKTTAAASGALTILALTPATGKAGAPYTAQLQATGAKGNVAWSPAPGLPMPTGMTIDASGKVAWAPTQAGPVTFVVQATDQAGTATKAMTLTIGA